MANPPLPAIAPPTVNALSGGVWVSNASQNTQAANHGPVIAYADTRQWMSISYTRNPSFTMEPIEPPAFRSLMIVSSTDRYDVKTTQLHYNVRVHNSCTKVNQTYSTPSYHQPQKFDKLNSATGKAGYYYGPYNNPANRYIFGAQGIIFTIQPYIKRELWDDNVHSEYSITTLGSSHALKISGDDTDPANGPGNWGESDPYLPYTTYLHSSPSYGLQDLQYSPQFPFLQAMAGPSQVLHGGGYATSSEVGWQDNVAGLQNMIQFINSVAFIVQGDFPGGGIEGFSVIQPIHSDGFDHIVQADRVPANPYYDLTRHDFS